MTTIFTAPMLRSLIQILIAFGSANQIHGRLANYFDYLPSDSLLPGQGSPPVFSGDLASMRTAFDLIIPLIRKAGPRPASNRHAADIPLLTPVQATTVPSQVSEEMMTKFIDGILASSSYEYKSLLKPPAENGSSARSVEACQLTRWNFELPLTRIPNMILYILGSKQRTAEEVQQFLPQLFGTILTKIGTHYINAKKFRTSNYFKISGASPNVTDTNECGITLEHSYREAIHAITYLFNLTIASSQHLNYLKDIIGASSSCFDDGNVNSDRMPMLLPCLDYSLRPETLLQLRKTYSVFNSHEICRELLTPPISKCLTTKAGQCNAGNLVSISIFARSFYMCNRVFPRLAFDEVAKNQV